eukprot:5030486-Karenia_brevis.AAC.1
MQTSQLASGNIDVNMCYGPGGEVHGPPPGIFGCRQPLTGHGLLSLLHSESWSHHKAFNSTSCNTEESIAKTMLDAFTHILVFVNTEIAAAAFSLTLQNLCILADSVLHAKCGNQGACHAPPELFDAYDDIQCDCPLDHQ